jgi:glutamine amidotransferase
LIRGDVVHLDELNEAGSGARVPHTGWSTIVWRTNGETEPLADLRTGYFTHSFYLKNPDGPEVVATAAFGKSEFPVAMRVGSLFATQFHPEKSGRAGLRLLSGWAT